MTPQRIGLICSRGGVGCVLGFHSDVLTIALDASHPPGAPVELELRRGDEAVAFEAKVIGGRKTSDNHFELRLKIGAIRKEARATLLSWTANPS